MSGFFSLRRLLSAAILVSAVTGVSTLLAQTVPSTSGPAIPPAGSMPAPDAPIAIINGRPINNKAFNDIMMQVAGMRVFQQVFDLSLVQSACLDSGVPLEGAIFQKHLDDELIKTMDGLNIKAEEGKPAMTKDERLNALGGILQKQGITAVEFRLGLETRAGLRAMSDGKITVSDEDIKDAYDSEYGEKRKVHIMTYPDGTSVAAIRNALGSKKPDGTFKTPEDVATEMKLPAPAVWVISANAKNIEDIRKVVWTLKAPRDVSAETEVANANNTKQKVLIQLDEITADRTGTIKLPSVTAELKTKVFDFKQAQWMNSHLASLRSRASVDIKDAVLAEQFKQISDAMTKQAKDAAATTQPGGVAPAPATGAASTSAPAPKNP